MKKAALVSFSLRKLFIAMLAVGPVAVLPSSLWATLPASTSFTVTNGSATVTTSSGVATINASDRSVLVWGFQNSTASQVANTFNIGTGETYNFALPSGGAVLNKVGYFTNGTLATADTATIKGTLVSNGKVFLLANGQILVDGGANIQTTGGTVLSTLQETSDFSFTTTSNLSFTGAAAGTINLGNGSSTAITVSGNVGAWAGTILANNVSVSGDMIVNQSGSTTAFAPATKISTGGNLTITTNNGVIGNNGTAIVTAANITTLSSGTAAINLDNIANDFGTLAVNTSGTGGTVTVTDANIITLGASTVGGDYLVRAGGLTNNTGIATSGAVAVTGNVQLLSATSANSNISFQSGSSVGNTISAITAGGAITINATGNLTVGNVTNNLTPNTLAGTFAGGTATTYTSATAVATAPAAGVISAGTITPNAAPLYTGNVTLAFESPIASANVTFAGGLLTTGSAGAGTGVTPAADKFLGGGNYTGLAASDFAVVISGGGGTGATGTLTIAGDVVSGINITAAGTGYTAAPTITIVGVTVAGLAHDAAVVAPAAVATLNSTTGILNTAATFTTNGAGFGSLTPNVTYTAPAFSTQSVTITSTGNVTTASAGRATNLAGGGLTAGIRTGRAASITGSNVTIGAGVVSANTSSNGTVTVNATAGNASLGGAITGNVVSIRATGGNITQTAIITTGNTTGTSTFNATGASVTLDQANVFANGQPLQVTGNNVLVTGATNQVVIGTSNVTGNLTVNATTAAKNVVLGFGTGVGVGQNITVGGNLFVNTTGTGQILDNDYSAITVNGTANLTTGGGLVAIDAAVGVATPTARYGQFNINTNGGAITLAESTTVNLGTIGNVATIPTNLAVTSVTGGIIDTGNIVISGIGNFTVSGINTTVLDSSGSVIPTINVIGGGENAVTALNGNVILGNATTVPTNLTVGTNNGFGVTLSNFTAAGNLTVNSGAWIDVRDSATVTGNLTLNATGNFPAIASLPFTTPYATIINAVANTTLGANVTAVSTRDLPVLTFSAAPTVTVGAVTGVVGTPATVVANLDANGLIANFTITSPSSNAYTAAPTLTFSGGTPNTSITESTGTLTVGGITTINSTGNAQLFRGNDFIGGVVLNNMPAGATINDVNNLTVSGNAIGAITAGAGTNGGNTTVQGLGATTAAPTLLANAWNLTLGNLNVGTLTATARNGGGGNSGTITQSSGSVLHVDNLGTFQTTNGAITLANANNSVGPVSLTAGTANISYSEASTVKLRNLSLRGNATITAVNGSIIEDVAANTTIGDNGTLTLNAANGSISIGGTTQNGTFTTTGNVVTVTANAPSGSVALFSSADNATLSTIRANSLTVNATGNLVQSNSISVFGTANFTSAGNITLDNTSNNFGPIIVNSTGSAKNVVITEAGTMNLRTIAMSGGTSGNFTATSVGGDIISTGFGGVRPGGTIASPGSGVVSLVASAGNITVGDATTDFPTTGGVVFNGNNVSLTVLGGTGGATPIVLGANGTASVARGTLTVSSATGSILNAGNLSVTGNATFTTGIGNISLNQSGDAFGGLKFVGNQVSIIQANDMKVLTGSSALSTATLGSSGNISITNVGGQVSFGNTVSMSATGSITLPKLIQASGTITVNAAGAKDLSALSITSDLGGKTPVNLGTGAYTAPQP